MTDAWSHDDIRLRCKYIAILKFVKLRRCEKNSEIKACEKILKAYEEIYQAVARELIVTLH